MDTCVPQLIEGRPWNTWMSQVFHLVFQKTEVFTYKTEAPRLLIVQVYSVEHELPFSVPSFPCLRSRVGSLLHVLLVVRLSARPSDDIFLGIDFDFGSSSLLASCSPFRSCLPVPRLFFVYWD